MARPLLLRPDGSVALTHGDLPNLVAAVQELCGFGAKGVVFLYAPNNVAGAAALLALLQGPHAVALLDPATDAARASALIAHWSPHLVLQFDDVARTPGAALPAGLGGILGDLRIWRGAPPKAGDVHTDLKVLLSTSGTVGSPKFVRLSSEAVAHNAGAIGAALAMTPSDVGIAHLPLHYSYGLSVVTSHHAAGAALVPLDSAIMSGAFWAAVKACGGTQFPGVPFHYETLARFGLARLAPPCITSFTQAGGHLDVALRVKLQAEAAASRARFYVMYGQTEASPRMTTLDHADLVAHAGSVGRALRDAAIVAEDENGQALPALATGNLVYRGPNVMLGYAETPADLARGDDMDGRLATGDIGHVDADGFVYITGRNARFAKVAGLRLALDEMERRLKGAHDVALLPGANCVIVFAAGESSVALEDEISAMARDYKVPRASFNVRYLDAIPLKSSGKVDYAALRAQS